MPSSSDEEDVKPLLDSDHEPIPQDDPIVEDAVQEEDDDGSLLEYANTPTPPPPPTVSRIIYNENISDGETSSEESDYEFVHRKVEDSTEQRTAPHPKLQLVEPTKPDVINRIPPPLFQNPRLPTHGVVWSCPLARGMKKCEFKIDFTKLNAEQMIQFGLERNMAKDVEKHWLRKGITSDAKLLKAFELMAGCHWKRHLHEMGIKRAGDGVSLFDRHPCSQPHSSHYFLLHHYSRI